MDISIHENTAQRSIWIFVGFMKKGRVENSFVIKILNLAFENQ